MVGFELTTPTATQVFESEHEILARELSPGGDVWGFQVEPSVVFTMVEPPTAVHSVVDGHESDRAGNVESCMLQLAPPSEDFMIHEPPPA